VSSGSQNLRGQMAAALTEAMRSRDRVAVTALRSALAAVANAEAVPVDTMPRAGAVESTPVGAGAADAPRRELTEHDVRAVVAAELAEHEHSAAHLRGAGRPEEAERVAAEAAVLRELLASTW
jgi:uncharacterized protein